MNVYIDADAFVRFEKGEFDLPGWLEERPGDSLIFPATVWQQLVYGVYAWEKSRARKRLRGLEELAFPDFELFEAARDACSSNCR